MREERPPAVEEDGWARFRTGVALALDALRFHEPPYGEMPFLRRRAIDRTPPPYAKLLAPALTGGRRRRAALRRALRLTERAVPLHAADDGLPAPRGAGRHARHAVRRLRHAAVALDPQRPRARRALLHRRLLVGRAHRARPDPRDAGSRDGVERDAGGATRSRFHDVPPERVVATGAQAYDHWFDWAPRTEREEFCARVGLPADRPYILYLASSGGYVKQEAAWVLEWIARLRAEQPALRDVGVLVRPHPKTKEDWHAVERADVGPVRVWPRQDARDGLPAQLSDYNVGSATAKREFFDSIHHAAAVVGVNTSALIESAIVGRPVHTFLDARWRYAQEQTLHFRQLVEVAGGVLDATDDFAEHAAGVARSVQRPEAVNGRGDAFLRAFIRPEGLDVPAGPALRRRAGGARRRGGAGAARPDGGGARAGARSRAARDAARPAAREPGRVGVGGEAPPPHAAPCGRDGAQADAAVRQARAPARALGAAARGRRPAPPGSREAAGIAMTWRGGAWAPSGASRAPRAGWYRDDISARS